MFEIFAKLKLEEVKEFADIITNGKREEYHYDDASRKTKKEIFDYPILEWLCDRLDGREACEKQADKKNISLEKHVERRVLERAADYFKIKYSDNVPNKRLETYIMNAWVEKTAKRIERMKPAQREKFAKDFEEALKKDLAKKGIPLKGGSISSVIMTGKISHAILQSGGSKLGLYLVTTKGLNALSKALSVQVSKTVFFKVAPKFLKVFLGPIGWGLMAGSIIMDVGMWATKDNWKHLIAFVIGCIAKKNDIRLEELFAMEDKK